MRIRFILGIVIIALVRLEIYAAVNDTTSLASRSCVRSCDNPVAVPMCEVPVLLASLDSGSNASFKSRVPLGILENNYEDVGFSKADVGMINRAMGVITCKTADGKFQYVGSAGIVEVSGYILTNVHIPFVIDQSGATGNRTPDCIFTNNDPLNSVSSKLNLKMKSATVGTDPLEFDDDINLTNDFAFIQLQEAHKFEGISPIKMSNRALAEGDRIMTVASTVVKIPEIPAGKPAGQTCQVRDIVVGDINFVSQYGTDCRSSSGQSGMFGFVKGTNGSPMLAALYSDGTLNSDKDYNFGENKYSRFIGLDSSPEGPIAKALEAAKNGL